MKVLSSIWGYFAALSAMVFSVSSTSCSAGPGLAEGLADQRACDSCQGVP